MTSARRATLGIIFATVFMDLVGFGMIIPLQAIYARSLGASGWVLGLIGAAYPLAQFAFAPLWGRLGDRHGRRPILLMSMTGSTLSYLGFALATYWNNLPLLIATRALQGTFAANVSAAQAYIADVTPVEKRSGGMALIGVAFGLGFVIGPVLGGLSSKFIGPLAPGLLAAAICGTNLLAACFRLPESLSREAQLANRARPFGPYDPLHREALRRAFAHPYLGRLLLMSFLQIVAFGLVEQVFALFFAAHLGLGREDAALRTGYALAYVGVLGALVQGIWVRRHGARYGERKLLLIGLTLFVGSVALIPFGPTYASYFVILVPLALGRSLIDPNVSSLISRAASAEAQGQTFGTFQGLSSLARIVGPFVGLNVFELSPSLPFFTAALVSGCSLALGFGLPRAAAPAPVAEAHPAA
ncbi:MAG TPA: MFS transporter [Polyangiaceae bacterium]|nr:MFS transporter [Polyangiaceae bacterium]